MATASTVLANPAFSELESTPGFVLDFDADYDWRFKAQRAAIVRMLEGEGDASFSIVPSKQTHALLKRAYNELKRRETNHSGYIPGSPQALTWLIEGIKGDEQKLNRVRSVTESKRHALDGSALAPLNLTIRRLSDLYSQSSVNRTKARFLATRKSKRLVNLEPGSHATSTEALLLLQIAVMASTKSLTIGDEGYKTEWRNNSGAEDLSFTPLAFFFIGGHKVFPTTYKVVL